mmetsp:Transcript_15461/g.25564  ORF Transcript_15461/g.25564 Transcript_15461/m.25564 type:complete len:98 (-) Transcript_15461:670-963(-)
MALRGLSTPLLDLKSAESSHYWIIMRTELAVRSSAVTLKKPTTSLMKDKGLLRERKEVEEEEEEEEKEVQLCSAKLRTKKPTHSTMSMKEWVLWERK